MEDTTARQIDRRRQLACQANAVGRIPIDARHSRQQRFGVRMMRTSKHLSCRPKLHQATQVQHCDAIREVAHHAEIMRDHDVARLLVALQIAKQVEDRSLHRHVQCTRGLVADDDAWATSKGTCDRDALLEPARQRARAHVEVPRREPDLLRQRPQPLVGLWPTDTSQFLKCAFEDCPHSLRAVECRVGILEDDLNRSSRIACAARCQTSKRLSIELDDRAGIGGVDAQDRLGQRRLARAGLANESERLARAQVKIDVNERAHLVAALLEGL